MEQAPRLAFIGAVIGAVAIIAGSIITYVATIRAPKIPIEASQTAEAKQAENILAVTPMPTLDLSPMPDNLSPVVPLVEIVFIDYTPQEGLDEFVEIKSNSNTAVDMRNWVLSDEIGNDYRIDFDFVLEPGATVKVWTKEGTNTRSDLFWGRKSCVWNDDSPDTAYLKDRTGALIDDYSYKP